MLENDNMEIEEKESEYRRFSIRLNKRVFDKLKEVSDGYGMSINGLAVYILGQWVYANYDMKHEVNNEAINKMVQAMSSKSDKMFESPEIAKLMEMTLGKLIESERKLKE